MGIKLCCPQCRQPMTAEQVIRHPPKGAWYREEIDQTVIGASTRSPTAFFLVPFMCAWSVPIVVMYGSVINAEQFQVIPALFGIPFIVVAVFLGAASLMMMWGKVEVSIGRTSSVFVGIGDFGWKRSFDWSAVWSIREERVDDSNRTILLEGNKRLYFGTELNDQRRYFVLNALKLLRGEMR